MSSPAEDIEQEQKYVSRLYDRVDDLRSQVADRLAAALAQLGVTHQERSHRDGVITMYSDQVQRYEAVEDRLCFGRLDMSDGERRYIGRIGVADEYDDYTPLLMDWRAPAARPFYLATAAAPDGVHRRRHIRTLGRRVVDLDDEVLDLADPAAASGSTRVAGVTGEAALLAALDARRTGRMRDIVETIQAEQDRVIRAGLNGVLVVQGGPGTGKTAVALHRAAYLLYTYREQLSARALLIVGPNATFLKYVSQVLPSLAETGVLLRTVGELYPGIVATGTESDAAAEVKGRAELVDVLAAGVADRQWVPDEYLEVPFDREVLQLPRAACEAARERARALDRPHNVLRPFFEKEIIAALAELIGDRIGTDPYAFDPLGGNDAPGDPHLLAEPDLAEIRAELTADDDVLAAIDRLWPRLTPEQFLADLYASDERLATAAPQLSAADRALLRRDPGAEWTPADVPLLDEAAELLGEDQREVDRTSELREQARRLYAEGALEILHGSRSLDDEEDPEILMAGDLIDASQLGERHDDARRLTAAERAAVDRLWTFGHVIVDEAQELSPMTWRLLMRRCPSRSMTLVGDTAQTGSPAGTSSWQRVLEPYVADRWRLTEMAVNYRTPAEVMAVAGKVLTRIDGSEPPRSVRSVGVEPWHVAVEPAELADRLVTAVRQEAAAVGEGRVGVLVPAGALDELGAAVAAAVPGTAVGVDADLENPVVVLTVRQAKGLEFDAAIVVDPERIVAESPRGLNDLYVALTRPTQRLGVLATGRLAAILA